MLQVSFHVEGIKSYMQVICESSISILQATNLQTFDKTRLCAIFFRSMHILQADFTVTLLSSFPIKLALISTDFIEYIFDHLYYSYLRYLTLYKTFGVHTINPPIENTLKKTIIILAHGLFNLALIAHQGCFSVPHPPHMLLK